jgi:hypothetical protein
MRTADLHDARESLEYWESRAQRLPRWALRRRREARAMAARWNVRVRDAERSAYGDGVLGTVLMLAFERRLPLRVKRSGRQAARLAIVTSAAVLAAAGALVTLAIVAVLQLVF